MLIKFVKTVVAALVLLVCVSAIKADDLSPQPPLRVLSFQADNGFQHKSKSVALQLVERLGKKNGWEVVTTIKSASLTELDLSTFDVLVFNNNCRNQGQIMKPAEQSAFQKYVQNGCGFLGVHCAGAIWKEVPVNPDANPSKMAIGQERDAINHPGKESFDGSIARFLIYERPLSDAELNRTIKFLSNLYSIKKDGVKTDN